MPGTNKVHSVWKSQKKSHSTLRAKRATFTFWVDKSWLKMPKMVHFDEFLKTWSLRSNSVTRQVSFNRTKIGGKCQNWKNANATFWVIFKQCVLQALMRLLFCWLFAVFNGKSFDLYLLCSLSDLWKKCFLKWLFFYRLFDAMN